MPRGIPKDEVLSIERSDSYKHTRQNSEDRYHLRKQKKLASTYEFLGVIASSFVLNLIPFAGPSNLLIAFNAAMLLDANPLVVGLSVAIGSSGAKLIHYVITFFLGGAMKENHRRNLEDTSRRLGWKALAVFLVAATPLPDEPVVIPLGFIKYSPTRFLLAYFSGKLLITSLGAYLGRLGNSLLSPIVNQELLTALSIALTLVVTVVVLKVDIGKMIAELRERLST